MKLKITLGALCTVALWALLYSLVKLGFAAYHVETTADLLYFAGVRFTICGSVICLITLASGGRRQFANVGRSILPILLSGTFTVILHYSFSYAGLALTPSGISSLLKQCAVLLYVCCSSLFIKSDKPTPRKIAAAIMGFCGVIVLNLDGVGGISITLGSVLILISSFCAVAADIVNKNLFRTVSPIAVTGISQAFGGVVLLIVGKAMGGSAQFAFDSSLLLMVGICAASIASFCIWHSIMKEGELSRMFIIKFSEPLFACVFGALLLGENIRDIRYLIALLLIGGSIALLNLPHKKETQA